MMKKELFDIIGQYDVSLLTSQEFDLNMRTLRAGLGIANHEDELFIDYGKKPGNYA
jgi:hypothetical protein